MPYDFDTIISRTNTNSLKYDFAAQHGKPAGILPMWVADMDFRLPPEILADMSKVIDLGIFGYSEPGEGYFNALHQWFLTYFHWDIEPEWLLKTPGIVFAIAMAIQAFTKQGEAVMIQPPVYYCFRNCVLDNDRTLVNSPLIYENGRYRMDFDDIEARIISENVKLFLLCSPHNPTGRVWTSAELSTLAAICYRNGVIVLSDEIHCDFTFSGHTHRVFATLSKGIASQSIICTSPGKTFNLAGLQASNIIIPDGHLRARFKRAIDASGYSQLNTLGLVACQSAYEKGGKWLLELKAYLQGNLNFLRDFLQDHLPEISLVEPEGTYLIWLDCRGLFLNDHEINRFMTQEALLWLDGGTMFGKEGSQFQRINIACPRTVLKQALLQLETACKKRND